MLMIYEINLKTKGLCPFIRPSFKHKAKSQPISPMGQFLKKISKLQNYLLRFNQGGAWAGDKGLCNSCTQSHLIMDHRDGPNLLWVRNAEVIPRGWQTQTWSFVSLKAQSIRLTAYLQYICIWHDEFTFSYTYNMFINILFDGGMTFFSFISDIIKIFVSNCICTEDMDQMNLWCNCLYNVLWNLRRA